MSEPNAAIIEARLSGFRDGWVSVTCQRYEALLGELPDAHVFASLTDPDGCYGSPRVYTLWGVGEQALLSTVLVGRRGTPEYKCWHAALGITEESPDE